MPPDEHLSRNRRLVKRKAVKRSTAVSCLKGTLGLGSNLAISMADASEGGARLMMKTALTPGEEVELFFTPLGMSKAIQVFGKVVWCVAAAQGHYSVGIQFNQRLAYHEISRL